MANSIDPTQPGAVNPTGAANSQTPTAKKTNQLGQDDFLKLMLTQLQN